MHPLGRSGAIDEDEFAVVVKRLFKNTELSRLAEEQVRNLPNALAIGVPRS